MASFEFTSPEGKTYTVAGPDGATKEQAFQILQSQLSAKPAANTQDTSQGISKASPELREGPAQFDRIKSLFKDSVKNSSGDSQFAIPEMALSAGTGIGSAIVGGLAGLARTGYNLLAGEGLDKSTELGAKTVNAIQQAATYQPRTSAGKLGNEIISAPLNAAKSGLSAVAGDVGEYIDGAHGRNVGESIGKVGPDIYATLRGGRNALRAVPEQLAKEPIPGKDFTPLRDLSPVEAERMQRMTEQGIKPTLGQITRDPEQWRFEEQTGKQTSSKAGEQLRQRELDTNDALIKAVSDTDTMRKGRAVSENAREMGATVGNALKSNSDASLQNIGDLYNKAKTSGETKQIVNTKSLESYLADEAGEHPALDVIQRKLDRLKAKNGGKISIDDAETLYRTASDQTKYGDPSSVYMGRVKAQINAMTDGAGGDLYRTARSARLAHGLEYEDRGAIARLIENKAGSRTDVKTASEDVFNKTVVNSSLEELKDVTNSLEKNGSKQSLQAIREMQGQTIDYILGKATEKGVTNERGVSGLSAPSLRNAMKEIGTDKLTHLLGDDAVKRLENIVKNAQDTKQKPGQVSGSDTGLNITDALKNDVLEASRGFLLNKLPGGKIIGDFLDSRKQQKITQDRANEALNPRKASTNEIQRQANAVETARKNQRYGGLNNSLQNLALPAYVGQESSKNKLIELLRYK